MASKGIFHEAAIHASQNDKWTITYDPLTVSVEGTNLLVDVGAEKS